jgi:hypothetical protein
MDERDGPSCTELINNSTVKKVYCGYIDPTQDDDTRQFNLMETADRELRNKCKQFADTFLDDVDETQTLDERRKKKRRVRHAAYGPGLFGGYGYYAGYSGDSSGDGGGAGGGESIKNEDAMMGKLEDGGKIIRILKKAHTVPFSDEKNWLLVDVDPAKGNKGLGLKWIPADTRFEWVRPYRDSVDENFADGKNPQDKGDSKRHGINTKASVSSLRKTAKQGGRKGQLAHWLANMKSGRQK